MATQKSAGILVHRKRNHNVEFLLAHPGGPFWKNKDDASWSVPKGLIADGEENHAAAAREFEEEVGQPISGDFMELTPLKQKSGKLIYCWLVEADLDLSSFKSNSFELEWPPKSGKVASFPEIDRVEYMPPWLALRKIHPGQVGFLLEGFERLGVSQAIEPSVEARQGSLF